MISQKNFEESVNKFDVLEARTDIFTLARNLISSGFEKEALLLILATWNFAAFRYAVKDFDIERFSNIISELKPVLDHFKEKQLQNTIIDHYYQDVENIFDTLAKIKGVKFTGASKLMHLINPDVFVMWDGYIRGEKPQKYYKELPVFKNGDFKYKKYEKSGAGYVLFLKDMKEKFKHLHPPRNKGLAKSIDEFNYVNITLEYQKIEKTIKLNKKNNEKTII